MLWRSEKLHTGGAVPRRARALTDRAVEQDTLASCRGEWLFGRWSGTRLKDARLENVLGCNGCGGGGPGFRLATPVCQSKCPADGADVGPRRRPVRHTSHSVSCVAGCAVEATGQLLARAKRGPAEGLSSMIITATIAVPESTTVKRAPETVEALNAASSLL